MPARIAGYGYAMLSLPTPQRPPIMVFRPLVAKNAMAYFVVK